MKDPNLPKGWKFKKVKYPRGKTTIMFLVQACLRAPHVVADEAKLAIVFTYLFFLGNFYFFTRKKTDFRPLFRNGQHSVTEPGPTPSPWSI